MSIKDLKIGQPLSRSELKTIEGGYFPTKEQYYQNPNDPKWDIYGDNLYDCYN